MSINILLILGLLFGFFGLCVLAQYSSRLIGYILYKKEQCDIRDR